MAKFTSAIVRQGLSIATACVLLSSCVEIDIPQPQYPAGQGQPIYVIDSSKTTTNVNMDSAFVLNLVQNFKDSSSVMVDARTNVENGSTTVLGGENGNGSNVNPVVSTETKVVDLNGGILVTVRDPSKLKLLFKESTDLIPSKIKDFPENDDRNTIAIVTVGFEQDNGLKYPISWEHQYLYGPEKTDQLLTISSKGFDVIPWVKNVTNNVESYIGGVLPVNHGKDTKKLRTIAGITPDGELLILCADKYVQDAYELLIAYGAIESKIIILADSNISYSRQYRKGGYIYNYETKALAYLCITE